MPESWVINSDHSEAAFIANVKKLRAEHKYITYSAPRIGADRSIDQNALFHVWATEYAAFLLKKSKKEVSSGELDGMKRIIKREYCRAHPNHFMVHEIVNPRTGETKKDYTSSANWKSGEMFMVLEWMQMQAAHDGLILESIGQYAKFQREQNA
jgi:hypothetical protein